MHNIHIHKILTMIKFKYKQNIQKKLKILPPNTKLKTKWCTNRLIYLTIRFCSITKFFL